ncbi:MAG: DUF2431 domain-containing protein [Rickettsia endosymbiont of Glossina mortisans submortisans]|nr:DUF2431 domain-containing protein [Rickettsia endosymbiont of Glossina mortisans submortisans]
MINKEDFDCAFKILELQINILNLKLQQVKLGYYRRNTILKVLDSKLLTLLKSITKLHKTFNHNSFDTIIFQFPHSGSREEINSLNPNYILVRNFIISASYVLKKHGLILITIVDSYFYNSIFQFEKLSQELKISTPIKYKFDPKDYPEYVHTMTNQDESAIEGYSKFATWEFKL